MRLAQYRLDSLCVLRCSNRTFNRLAAACVALAAACLAVPLAPAQARTVAKAEPALASATPVSNAAALMPAAGVAAPGRANAAAKPGSGGMREGIKVHGHWTIEVRKPNGKLISHTEFENSLIPGGGGAVLPLFLAQNATQYTSNSTGFDSYTPGEWGILLGDASSPPCSATVASLPFNFNSGNGQVGLLPAFPGPWCVLTQLAPPAAIYPANCGSGNVGCSYNLGLQLATSPSYGLLLTGTVVSQTAGTISQVQTLISVCSDNVAPSKCWAETSPDATVGFAGGDLLLAFTAAPLPASNTTSTPCGGTGQISCAVNVPEAGDTIDVQVTLSFQ
jgi:hypothetical protein